jgi:hypothetical protein
MLIMQAGCLTVRSAATHRDYIATLSEDMADSLVLVARLQPAGESGISASTAQSCHAHA